MGRKSNQQERRAQIADAAIAVLAEVGILGMTTKAVAERASLSPGLLHYHFASKEAVVIGALDALVARLHARFASGGGIRALLRALLDVGAPDEDAVRAWVHLASEAMRSPNVKVAFDSAVTRLEDALSEAIAADYPRAAATDRRHAVAAIMATVHGAFTLAHATSRPVPRGYALKAALAHLEPLEDAS